MDNTLGKKLDLLYREFKQNAGAVAAEVYRAADLTAARDLVVKIILELQAQNIVAVETPLVKSLELEKILPPGTLAATTDIREKAVSAKLGISELELAIAETGTLVQDAAVIDKRLVSMLPPVHLALVRTDHLVSTFLEAVDLINEQLPDISEYVAFISGPSRTADIERVLTIGVHGPGRLIIIFVD